MELDKYLVPEGQNDLEYVKKELRPRRAEQNLGFLFNTSKALFKIIYIIQHYSVTSQHKTITHLKNKNTFETLQGLRRFQDVEILKG